MSNGNISNNSNIARAKYYIDVSYNCLYENSSQVYQKHGKFVFISSRSYSLHDAQGIIAHVAYHWKHRNLSYICKMFCNWLISKLTHWPSKWRGFPRKHKLRIEFVTQLKQQSTWLVESALGQSYAEWPNSKSKRFSILWIMCTGHDVDSMADLFRSKFWATGGISFEQAVKFRGLWVIIVQENVP